MAVITKKKSLFVCMVMTIVFLITLLVSLTANADVIIDDSSFPDLVYREYVSVVLDKDHNGILSRSEIDSELLLHHSGDNRLYSKYLGTDDSLRFGSDLPFAVSFTYDQETAEVNTEIALSYELTGGTAPYSISYTCYSYDNDSLVNITSGNATEASGTIRFTPVVGQSAFVVFSCFDAVGRFLSEHSPKIPLTGGPASESLAVSFVYDQETAEVNTEIALSYELTGGTAPYSISYTCYSYDNDSLVNITSGNATEASGTIRFTPVVGQSAFVAFSCFDAVGRFLSEHSPKIPLTGGPASESLAVSFVYDQETAEVNTEIALSYELTGGTAPYSISYTCYSYDNDSLVNITSGNATEASGTIRFTPVVGQSAFVVFSCFDAVGRFLSEHSPKIQLYESNNPNPEPVPDEEQSIQAFVKRCYSLILGRDADEGGLKSWSEALANKTAAAANIIDGFIKSDEFTNRKLTDGEQVDILYKTMLGREADAGGKAGWVDALGKGYTLQHIINGFCGSEEFKKICDGFGIESGSVNAPQPSAEPDADTPRGKIEAFVKRCYQLILNRQADEGGLKGWSDALEGKTAAAAQIIDGFVRSPEYINRSLTSEQSVSILYKTMLDRDPDEGGKAGWVDALSKGYTLQHIINGFCGSAEFTKICSDYDIEAGSVAVPVQSAAALEAAAQLEAKKLPDERIGNAVSADDAGITVVNGYEPAEVEAFVKHAYRAALGREADEAGLAGWTEQIVSGAAAPKAFLRTLLGSNEFAARNLSSEAVVETLYRLYLNRGMDDAAADRVAQLAAGGLDEVIKGFEGSAEFRLVLNGFGL